MSYDIRTKPTSDAYRDGWERTFGRPNANDRKIDELLRMTEVRFRASDKRHEDWWKSLLQRESGYR